MPVDVTRTLRQALNQLQSERHRIERQIRSIQSVLDGAGQGRGSAPGGGARRRRRMSAAARRAVSQRMKAYWASRRKQGGRGKAKAAKAAKAAS